MDFIQTNRFVPCHAQHEYATLCDSSQHDKVQRTMNHGIERRLEWRKEQNLVPTVVYLNVSRARKRVSCRLSIRGLWICYIEDDERDILHNREINTAMI